MSTALITGITGQDGSYLAEFLLKKGYTVYGLVRRSSTFNTSRLDAIYQDPHVPTSNLKLIYGDMTDGSVLRTIVSETQPNEIYNLAAQSHVRVSFDLPDYTTEVTAMGTLRLLEAIRASGLHPKFYQASSSEMFGESWEFPQRETTPFRPQSPYGVAKLAAHWMTVNARHAYNLFACCGILFNHESPRRGETFVTRKITKAAARIKLGLQHDLYLGNLDAQRDWGFAKDYVDAMWRMLQQDKADDYVIATGETHTVREWLTVVFGHLNLDYCQHIKIDARYYRPNEVNNLLGDATKARKRLGWMPSVRFKDLAILMTEADLREEQAAHGEQ